MPTDLDELEGLEIPTMVKRDVGGVEWEQLFDALCELGMGEDGTGFSVNDVHLLTRQFPSEGVEFDEDEFPISRQRVYKWVTELYQDRYAVCFRHPNAANYRYAFQKTKLDPNGEHKSIAKLIYTKPTDK